MMHVPETDIGSLVDMALAAGTPPRRERGQAAAAGVSAEDVARMERAFAAYETKPMRPVRMAHA